MLKIAVVTPMLPLPFDRTRGRYIHETARALGRLASVRVFFQTQRYPRWLPLRARSHLQGAIPADYRLDGCDVEAFSYPALPGLSRGVNGHVAAQALTPRVRRYGPDVVLGYWIYPDGYAAVRCARRLGLPCVVGALGSDIYVRSGINARMTRRTLADADAVITVSRAMTAHTATVFGTPAQRLHTIVNGFNTTVFRPRDRAAMRQALGVAADAELIVYVGRFVEAKGLRELLGAFGRLARQRPHAALALIGDGVMKEALHGLVRASGLEQRIHLPGGLEPDAVAQWIGAADLLTLPSWSEGYPNVLVEAIACGRPVVATDVGGAREIVDADNGLLVPARDEAALTAALEAALTRRWDSSLIASRCRRTWDDVAAETLAVCEQVRRVRADGDRRAARG